VRRWIDFLAGRGHELTLVTDAFTHNRPAECTIYEPQWNLLTKILAFRLTPRPFGSDRWKYLHYRPLVRRSRPDLVHGFEAFNYGLATAFSGPYPKVLTPWGKDIHHDANASKMGAWIVEQAIRGVDLISTNDESITEYLTRRFGIDPARVRAFSWGVDLRVFHPGQAGEAERWRQELQIPPDAPVIFSPRNFAEYWGSRLTLGAIPEVLRARPEAVFVILRGAGGDPQEFAAAQRRVQAEGLGESVRFVDRVVTGAELAGLFNLAEMFISVPQTDLLAQTILEGMACGCLPILGDQPAYRKHARPGDNALVLPEYSAGGLARMILEALASDALRERARRENPRLMATHEDWSKNALKMEEVYAEAIARHRAMGHHRG
jgi:glycosyltransferase involved in cell wall biosynthesis